MTGERADLIPPAGALRTTDEWRLWKLVEQRDGDVNVVFAARGTRADVLERLEEMRGWGFLPARWLLQRVYVCEVFGAAEEVA